MSFRYEFEKTNLRSHIRLVLLERLTKLFLNVLGVGLNDVTINVKIVSRGRFFGQIGWIRHRHFYIEINRVECKTFKLLAGSVAHEVCHIFENLNVRTRPNFYVHHDGDLFSESKTILEHVFPSLRDIMY